MITINRRAAREPRRTRNIVQEELLPATGALKDLPEDILHALSRAGSF